MQGKIREIAFNPDNPGYPSDFSYYDTSPYWVIRFDISNGDEQIYVFVYSKDLVLPRAVRKKMLSKLYNNMKLKGWKYNDLKRLPHIKYAKISRYIKFHKASVSGGNS